MDQVVDAMKTVNTTSVDKESENTPDRLMVTRIAGKIRAIRLLRNLTIKQLSEKANVTKGLLSKIENSRTIPSLPVFIQILRSLDISFSDFFADMEPGARDHFTVIRKDSSARSGPDSYGIGDEDTNAHSSSSPKVEMSVLNVRDDSKDKFQVTAAHRFIQVVSGGCQYQYRDHTIHLQQGDSIYFDGSVPHLLRNTRDRETFLLVIDFGG